VKFRQVSRDSILALSLDSNSPAAPALDIYMPGYGQHRAARAVNMTNDTCRLPVIRRHSGPPGGRARPGSSRGAGAKNTTSPRQPVQLSPVARCSARRLSLAAREGVAASAPTDRTPRNTVRNLRYGGNRLTAKWPNLPAGTWTYAARRASSVTLSDGCWAKTGLNRRQPSHVRENEHGGDGDSAGGRGAGGDEGRTSEVRSAELSEALALHKTDAAGAGGAGERGCFTDSKIDFRKGASGLAELCQMVPQKRLDFGAGSTELVALCQ
ncbi:hypothetical protein BaRGS_00025199, partial [Batillaria attramentaria]